MRFAIGIILIVTSSVLFTLLLLENTMSILAMPPLFVVGFGCIYSKIHEMEEDILSPEAKLNVFIKRSKNDENH